jgi:SRSO17 transposase
MKPKAVLIDARDGKNTTFLSALEQRQLKYVGGAPKKWKVVRANGGSPTKNQIR